MADQKPKAEFIWLDGQIVPFAEAKIHVLSPAVKYGFNVFEGIRAYWNAKEEQLYGFRLKDHVRRLADSAKMMRMKLQYTFEEQIGFLRDLFKANRFREDIYVRHTFYLGGYGGFPVTEPVGMFIVAAPRGRQYDEANGIKCCISSWTRTADNMLPPKIKAGPNYQNSRLALIEAHMDGYDNAILLTQTGKVAEGPAESIFAVRDGVISTPPLSASILESITRRAVIHLIKDRLKRDVCEREMDRTELYVADEVFSTGTGSEVTSVVNIDGYAVGDGKPGEITRRLQKIYYDVARGLDKSYPDWRTPTY